MSIEPHACRWVLYQLSPLPSLQASPSISHTNVCSLLLLWYIYIYTILFTFAHLKDSPVFCKKAWHASSIGCLNTPFLYRWHCFTSKSVHQAQPQTHPLGHNMGTMMLSRLDHSIPQLQNEYRPMLSRSPCQAKCLYSDQCTVLQNRFSWVTIFLWFLWAIELV